MATLRITFSDELLDALEKHRSITLSLETAGGGAGARGRPGSGDSGFRAGSLPDQLVAWARGRKRPFGAADVMKRFKVKRGHASMLLARVVGAGHLERVRRGAYVATGAQ